MSTDAVSLSMPSHAAPKKPTRAQLQGISKRVLDLLQPDGSFAKKRELKKYLSTVDQSQIAEALPPIMETLLSSKDPTKALHQLAELFPMEKLQKCVQDSYPDSKDALEDAIKMLGEAKFFLGAEGTISPTLRTKLSNILDSLIIALEGVLSAFGVADFFKQPDNDLHAQVKAQQILMLMTLFSLLTATFVPVLGAAMAGMVIGGTLLFIATLSLIYPYFRPLPSQLPKSENWSKQYRLGDLDVVTGRDGMVHRVAETLMSKGRLKRHPMLIGKSGAGKTETIKALVRAIEEGKYPGLEGMTVFYFNTAELVADSGMFGGGNKIIEKIKNAVGRHKGKVILVFDEIHLACKKKYAAIGSQLLTMLDPKADNFPYFIGLTTQENFDRHVMSFDKAFARRFKIFNLENPDDADTQEIIYRSYINQAPGLIVEQGAIDYLRQQTRARFPGSTEPASSLKILTNCIQATAVSQKSPLEDRVDALRKKIKSIYGARSVSQAKDRLTCQVDAPSEDVADLEKQLRGLEELLEKEKEELSDFFAQRETLGAARKKMYEEVLQVAKLKQGSLSKKERHHVNALMLLDKFFIPFLEDSIRAKATRLKVQTVIDRALIDRVIEAEKENEARVKEAIEQGRREEVREKKSNLS